MARRLRPGCRDRSTVRALWLAVVITGCGISFLAPAAARATHLIPPGQESLAAAMLGRDEKVLPGDCTFNGAVIRQTRVSVTYACGAQRNEVVIELRHSEEGGGTARTQQFTLVPIAGVPPGALLDALIERIRRFEGQWKWNAIGEESAAPPAARALKRTAVPSGRRWLMPAALLLIAAVYLRGRPGIPRLDIGLASMLGAGALGLRLLLGPWGPLRINGLGPIWLDGAICDPGQLYGYGPGYPEIFSGIARLVPTSPDMAIFAANTVLSALAPMLAFVLGRLVGLDRPRAVLAASLLAVDPVMLRAAATESYIPAIIALTSFGTVVLVAAAHQGLRGDWRGAALLGTAAGLALAQSVRIHPVAWIPAALAPLAVLAADERARLPMRLVLTAAAAAVVGAIIALTSGEMVFGQFTLVERGEVMTPSAPSLAWWLPVVATALGVAGFYWSRPRWLVVPVLAQCAALIATRHNFGQSWLWQQTYDRLYLAVPAVGLAALLRESWLAPPIVRGAAVVAGALLLLLSGPFLRERTTDQLEYRWVREVIRPIPPQCLFLYVGQEGKRNMVLPIFGAPARPARRAIRVGATNSTGLTGELHGASCLYYVHTSLCSSSDARHACERVESLLDLEPFAKNSFPAVPSNSGLPYDRPEVESVIYRVRRVR